jgi:hypothetical protein
MKRYLAIIAAVAAAFAQGPQADLSISGKVNGATLTIRTSTRMAGAIDSITWRGKEFINAHDHGRELQSASSYDGYGECLNPTEAGSAKDGAGPLSSSRLVESKAHGHTLETTIEMAYWLAPGTPYRHACGSHADFQQAKNETLRSKDLLIKRVSIEKNVVSYDITFVTAEDHQSATFEALTGYMPPEFSEFFAYDPATRTVVPLSDGPGEQNLPVILATPDHQFAMGVYSADLPQKSFPKNGYGRFRFMNNPKSPGWNTVKWNAVYRAGPAPHASYHFQCSVLIGTLEDVRRSLEKLHSIG